MPSVMEIDAAIAKVYLMRSRRMLQGAAVHIDPTPGMKRKRVQPRGSRECQGCGRTIGANKSHCWDCLPKEAA